MNGSVRSLAEVLGKAPHTGMVKSTHKLAKMLGLEDHRDYSRIDATAAETIAPSATDIWAELFSQNEIDVNSILYTVRQGPKRFLRPSLNFLTVIGYPAEYNKLPEGRSYSVDEREGRGTAHFALDMLLDKKQAETVQSVLAGDSSLLNEALALTEWSYHGRSFNPYEYFMLGPVQAKMEDIKSAVSNGLRLLPRYPVFKTAELDI